MIKSLSFIGAGQMAEALITGILSSGKLNSSDIIASDVHIERISELGNKYGIKTTSDNRKATSKQIVVLSVKPQNAKEVCTEISKNVENKLVISIMAGIRIDYIEGILSGAKIIRVMPNTPALVGKGISVIAKGKNATDEDINNAKQIMGSVGKVIELSEDNIDAVTALSGSGPAYFYWLTESLIEAGINMGLSEEDARMLAKETFIGSARLLDEKNEKVSTLIERVTSPGGTTEAALQSLSEDEVKELLIKAIEKAKERSQELSKVD